MKNKSFRKLYDKLLQSEDGIEESLSKASNILTSVNYVSNRRIRNSIKGFNVAIGVGMVGHTLFQYIREARENSMYSLVIDDLDESTFEVAENLMKLHQDTESIKSYTVRSKYESIPFSNKTKKILTTEIDQDSVVRMDLDGYEYQVVLSIPDPPSGKGKGKNDNGPMVMGLRNITFYCKKREGIEHVKSILQAEVDEMMKAGIKPLIYTNGDYGFNSTELRTRPLESIVLKSGQMEEVVDHINQFLEAESDHNKYGLPYHTGILLKGPPGTGKTSLVTGIASYFQTNLYQISLSEIDGDGDLIETFSSIKPRSIVVLEDLDVLGASNIVDRDAEYERESVTMSGLLNVLDGTMTPHGMILIATTNHAENLDPAITRTGRIDKTLELNYLDNDQLDRLVYFFTNKKFEFPEILPEDRVTSSDVSGIFRSHLKDPSNAIPEIRQMIEVAKLHLDIEEEEEVEVDKS